jgi:DNA-directed RNA polymerase specialized sigma subunit
MGLQKNILFVVTTSNYSKWLEIQRARREQVRSSYASGLSLAEVGKLYGISRARVWQIVKSTG